MICWIAADRVKGHVLFPVFALCMLAGGVLLAASAQVRKTVVLDLGIGVDAVTRATPGNPKGLRPPHLRKEVKRKPFMVPRGVRNLALYKRATSSVNESVTGDVDQVNDGIKKSGEFDYVEFAGGHHWIQVDLGAVHRIHAVAIWHFYKNATIYKDVIVQIADDTAFTRNVRTLFNNDHDNSAGMGQGTDTAFYTRWWGELVDARGPESDGSPARYVRVYTADGVEGEAIRFVEVEIYGE
jgi:hypothetical protein